jgi:signal transduction histidine kinase
MSDVSCWILKPLFEAVREAGHAPDELMAGLSLSYPELQKRSRVPWDVFVGMGERAAALLGGPGALEAIAADYARNPTSGVLRLFAEGLVGPRALYALGARWLGPSLFLATRATLEDVTDGVLRQTIEILPPHRDAPLFFHTMLGAIRTTPRILGMPDADVKMEIEERRAVYTITLPPRNRRRLMPWRRVSGTATSALEELAGIQSELQTSLRETRAQEALLRAQSRRLETLNRLSRRLARNTDVAELAQSVVGLLQEHFGFSSVRLAVALLRDGEELEAVRESGACDGTPTSSHELWAAGGVVGRLDLWGAGCDASEAEPDSDALLRDLLPWIATAFENARSFEALDRKTRQLAAETAERRRAEIQLEQATRMDALGRLAGGLAHDFNNVLTAIAGYAELAHAALPPGAEARNDLENIAVVSERAAGLTSQVLAFSRRQVLHPQRVDLGALIERLSTILRSLVREDIDLRILPDTESSVVMADAGRLEQVVLNLVANARDAMPSGGSVTVETENLRLDEAAVQGRPGLEPGGYVCLRVRDTGRGMDSETRERAFEPFFTTKSGGEGTGLGLATTYATVTQIGGTIDLETEMGKGTSVSILLPRVDGAVAGLTDAVPGRAAMGSETVLLVEDEPSVRAIALRGLRSRGYELLEARDGERALAICSTYRGRIDLLFTDMVLPGLDGRTLARQVAEARPELRAILYTSGYDAVADESGAPPRPHAFMRKPYAPSALVAEVRRMLDENPPDESGH